MIKPTVGRIVLFHSNFAFASQKSIAYNEDNPLAALVTHVHNDRMVNLAIFDSIGKHHTATSVPLKHGDKNDFIPEGSFYCEWIPFQKAQPPKTEVLEKTESNSVDKFLETRIPILDQITDLCHAIEKCGASPELTDAVVKAGALREPISELVRQALDLGIGAGIVSVSYSNDHAAAQSTPPTEPKEPSISEVLDAKDFKAPRITPGDIQANIRGECYFTAAQGWNGEAASDERTTGLVCPTDHPLQLLTFCVLTLQNGFTVTGESACVSPENFDAEIGRKIARKNAVEKIWPLMGYELKQRLYEQERQQTKYVESETDNSKILSHLEMNDWSAEERDGVVHVDCESYGWQPIRTLSEAVDFTNDNAALKSTS